MYNGFFQLSQSPFGTSPDPRFLHMMKHTREALACLEYGISERKGFIVLTGEVGTGKTTLLRRALAGFNSRRVSTAFVFNPRLDALDFLEFVLTDFGINPEKRTKSGMLLQLNRWLIEKYRMKETCVVVVDEAQNLSWDLLEEIRLLTNLETSSEKLLQIVLSGQPELDEKLRHPSVRQLRQRVSLWAKTQALTQTETHEYIAERLRIAGAKWQIFTPEAMDAVHLASRGIPRIMNLVCEHALIVAYVEQSQQVTKAMVENVAAELELETAPFLISNASMGGVLPPLRSATDDSGPIPAFSGEPKGRQER